MIRLVGQPVMGLQGNKKNIALRVIVGSEIHKMNLTRSTFWLKML